MLQCLNIVRGGKTDIFEVLLLICLKIQETTTVMKLGKGKE